MIASSDGLTNLYSSSYIFDARNFERAQNIQKGHVAAVMDVEFSPTGEELVSGSYVGSLSHPVCPETGCH